MARPLRTCLDSSLKQQVPTRNGTHASETSTIRCGVAFAVLIYRVDLTADWFTMKRLFFILFVLNCLSGVACADPLNYSRRDTQLHTAYSFIGSFGLTGFLKSTGSDTFTAVLTGAAATLSLGYAKEVWIDGRVSGNDMLANGVGVLGSSLFFLSLDF